MEDAIVIGGGPAGLAAATWLGRHRRRVLVVDGREPRNRWVESSHGYLGFDPVRPTDLAERARGDLAAYPTVRLHPGTAERATGTAADGFTVHIDGDPVVGRRLVLATGVSDTFPDIDGFLTHYGADVFHCPTCDGYDAEDRDVVAFGWNPEVAGFALELLDWAASVTIVTNGEPFEGSDVDRAVLARHGVAVVEDEAVGLIGDRGRLEALHLGSGDRLVCEVAFFSIDHRPVTVLAEQLGCALAEHGHVAVDEHGETSVTGVYAAGDLTPGLQLVQVAAAKGAVAGTSCAMSLRGKPPAPATPTPGPDVASELHDG